MRFWDASAIIPLLTDEPARGHLLQLLDEDPLVLVWWETPVEIASALARREREQSLDMVCLDARLSGAARREGFVVIEN
jgi:uncharacterized protein with PIN domain